MIEFKKFLINIVMIIQLCTRFIDQLNESSMLRLDRSLMLSLFEKSLFDEKAESKI